MKSLVDLINRQKLKSDKDVFHVSMKFDKEDIIIIDPTYFINDYSGDLVDYILGEGFNPKRIILARTYKTEQLFTDKLSNKKFTTNGMYVGLFRMDDIKKLGYKLDIEKLVKDNKAYYIKNFTGAIDVARNFDEILIYDKHNFLIQCKC